MRVEMKAHQERLMAITKAGLEEMEAAVETIQEEVKATDLEVNPDEKRVRGGTSGSA
jgi:adenine-specific DNA methylase